MPEFWAKLSIWPEHQELCLSKQLSLELEVLLTPMHYINIYCRKRWTLFICDHVLWYPQASLLQIFEKGSLMQSRCIMPGCYTPEQWAVKPRLWEEKKSWNYSGSRRKSERSGIFVREMRSLQLITVIQMASSDMISGTDSVDAVLGKRTSFVKTMQHSICVDGSITEHFLCSFCKGKGMSILKNMPSFCSKFDYCQLILFLISLFMLNLLPPEEI